MGKITHDHIARGQKIIMQAQVDILAVLRTSFKEGSKNDKHIETIIHRMISDHSALYGSSKD